MWAPSVSFCRLLPALPRPHSLGIFLGVGLNASHQDPPSASVKGWCALHGGGWGKPESPAKGRGALAHVTKVLPGPPAPGA